MMTKQTDDTTPMPVLVSWSSGKDSAWALHTLRQQPERYDVRGIFTTVTKTFDRVSIHSTPAWVLKQQAEKLAVPLYEIPIPYPCSNAIYEAAMRKFLVEVEVLPEHLTASHFAFGDLFLEDIRAYREDKLRDTGFTPIFPVWEEDTTLLAEKMIASGLRAIICSGYVSESVNIRCYPEALSFPILLSGFYPDPVGSVLRCTHPNAICIPNQTGSWKKDAKPK